MPEKSHLHKPVTETPSPKHRTEAHQPPNEEFLIQRALADPHGMTPDVIQALQKKIGNAAVMRLTQRPAISTRSAPAIQRDIGADGNVDDIVVETATNTEYKIARILTTKPVVKYKLEQIGGDGGAIATASDKRFSKKGDTGALDNLNREKEITRLQTTPEAMSEDAPYKAGKGIDTDGSFESWFNYFFTELPNRRIKAECFYEAGDNGKGGAVLTDSSQRKALLERMLKAGFTRIETPDTKKKPEEMVEQNATYALPGIPRFRVSGIGYRGDDRSPDTIKLHGGTKSKVLAGPLRKNNGMDQPWHPWSAIPPEEMEEKVGMLWRNKNKDNDLYTIVSVAVDIRDAAKFPLLSDMQQDANKKKNLIEENKKITHSSYIYLLNFDQGFDTEHKQQNTIDSSSFSHGEKAAYDLTYDRHTLAFLKIKRIYRGETSDEGIDIVVESTGELPALAKAENSMQASAREILSFFQKNPQFSYEQFFQKLASETPQTVKTSEKDKEPPKVVQVTPVTQPNVPQQPPVQQPTQQITPPTTVGSQQPEPKVTQDGESVFIDLGIPPDQQDSEASMLEAIYESVVNGISSFFRSFTW